MNVEEIAESVEAFTSAMNGHIHDLHPVVSGGELVASVCGSCWTQCSPGAWIRQNDAIQDEYYREQAAAEADIRRRARIAACDGHDHDEVQIMTFGTPGFDVLTGPCRKCGE